MLLYEYLASVGVPVSPGAGSTLLSIERFIFGPQYAIRFFHGKVIELGELEPMLEIMRSEFTYNRKYTPTVGRKKFHERGVISEYLCVEPIYSEQCFLPSPPIDELVGKLRIAVVTYNLTGSWDPLGGMTDAV